MRGIDSSEVVSRLLAASVGVFAVTALIGSLLAPEVLMRVVPGSHRLGMNSMLGLALASIALIYSGQVRLAAGGAVILIASVAIMQSLTAAYPLDGLWRVLINTEIPIDSEKSWAGRLSLSAGVGFLLIGTALVALDRVRTTMAAALLQVLISFVFVLAVISVYSHVLGITLVQERLAYPVLMSFPASICLLVLSCGIGLACVHRQWFSSFYSGREDRQIFAAAIAVLILMSLGTGLASTWIFSKWFLVFLTERHLLPSTGASPDALEFYQLLYDQVWHVIVILFVIAAFGSLILTRFVRPVAMRLQQQETLLAKVLETLPLGVWVADEHGRIQISNPAGLSIWGSTEAVDMAQYGNSKAFWHDTGQPIKPEEWALTRAIQEGKTSLNEVINIECTDGKRKALLNSAIPLRDANGVIKGAVAVNQDVTHNLLLAEELRRSKKFFQVAFESAAVGIVLNDPQGNFLDINQSFCDIVGYTRDELRCMHLSDLTHPEDLTAHMNGLRQLLRGEASRIQREKRYIHKQGHLVWVVLNAVLVPDTDGAPLYFIVQILDITERKRAMQSLLRWEDIFRHAEWGVAVCSAGCTTLELMNPAFASMHGTTVEELTGQPIINLFAQEHKARLLEHMIMTRLLGHHVFESMHIRKDGTIFPVLVDVTTVYDDDEAVRYRVFNVQDMTERKKADAALITSETNLNRAQEVAHIGSWSLDVGLNILIWTAETYRIFGVPQGTPLTYELFLDCVHPDDRAYVDRHWKTALQGGPYCIEHRIVAQGKLKWVEERADLHMDINGRLVSGIGTVQDITDKKEAEIELAASRQLLRELAAEDHAAREEEKKRIAREIHDELGQTLTALRMDISIMRIRFGAHEPAVMEKVKSMMVLVDRAIRGVRDVAANLRPAVLDMGIVPAIEWLCNEFSEHTNIPCVFQAIAEDLILEEARAVVIFRIVQESLTNIAKHAEASFVEVEISQREESLCVEIGDNGKGFDPTASINRKSFGLLGMRERTIALGGVIYITSTVGVGTDICVQIPINQDIDNL